MLFNPDHTLSIDELLQFTTHSSLKGVISERVFCVSSLKKNRKTMVVNGEKYDIVSTSNGQWYLKRSDSFYTYVLKPISQHNLNKHRIRDNVKKVEASINELKKMLNSNEVLWDDEQVVLMDKICHDLNALVKISA